MSALESAIPPAHAGVIDPTAEVPGPQKQTFGDPITTQSELLTIDPKEACKQAMKLFQSQAPLLKSSLEQLKINEWWRRGITGARLIKDPASGQWRARPPLKMEQNAEWVNKAASLCRKFVGVLTADPPAPEAVPGEGEGDDPSSAEFVTRALVNLDEEVQRIKKVTQALDEGLTWATTFEHFWYNPTSQGRVALELQQGYDDTPGQEAEAQTVFEAEFHMVPQLDQLGQPVMEPVMDDMGMPAVDPFTGMPQMQPAMQRVPWPKFKIGYVRPDGTFTDKRSEAAQRWQGGNQSEIVRATNVRLYPHTATDIDEAYGCGILTYVAWGRLKEQFPDLKNMAESDISSVFNWRPDWTEVALPVGLDPKALEASRADPANKDEWLVPVLTTYMDGSRAPHTHPRGVHMVQLGESHLLWRKEHEYPDGDGIMRPAMIPLAQLTLFREGRPGWIGCALMEIIGPGNEARAAQIGSLLEYLDRFASLKTMVPTSSIVDHREWNDRSKRWIAYDPAGGTPKVEDPPPYPTAAETMFTIMGAELDDACGLQQIGQGLEAKNVQSGVQAMAVISQVQAALAPQARALVDFYLRGERIQLQLVRRYYDKPRQIKWSGEDGRYKQQAWNRSDLGSVTDVRLEPGTMSMLRPAQKALLAREYLQLNILPPDEFRLSVEKNIGGTLALRDDPHRQRIRRQIEDWKAGPPEGWVPPEPVMGPMMEPVIGADGQQEIDPVTGAPATVPVIGPDRLPVMGPQVDPATGQPLMTPDPIGAGIWTPVPSDTMPMIAAMRLTELARLCSSLVYERAPVPWRMYVDQEFARMQMVVMPPMLPAPAPDEGGDVPRGTQAGGEAGGLRKSAQGTAGPEIPLPPPMPMQTAM